MTDEERDARDGRKLSLALDMHEFGVGMMRQNLIRRHPDAALDEIETRLVEWLQGSSLMGIRPDQFDPEGRAVI